MTFLSLWGLTAAIAQEEEQETAASMTVTGSRIQRAESTANSPIVTVDEREIARLGLVDAEEIVRELPQAVAGVSPGVNLGNPGVTTLNLRNIGQVRTLVLIDGKRFMPFDANGIVDINNIPVPLLERVDVVTGGASAVYGSDAMAGVVNFILRKDFEGLSVASSLRQTAQSDGATKHVSLTLGANFADGRGNGVLSFGWTDRESVFGNDRDFSRFAFSTASGQQAGSVVDTQGTLFCLPACFPPGGTAGGDFLVSFSGQGNLAPTGSRLFNYNDYGLLQVPQERFQGTALLRYELNDALEGYGRFGFTQTQIDTINAPSGTFFTRTFLIPLNSPSLSAQARQVLSDRIINATAGAPGGATGGRDGLVDPQYDTNNDGLIDANASVNEFFARRTVETGPRIIRNRSVVYQALAGVRGTLWADWNWDLSFQHGRTEFARQYTNDVDQDRMQAALAGCPAGSPARCVTGNFFGDGNLSDAAARFISLQVNDAVYTEQQVAMATFSGKLGEQFRVPGASAIGAAFGAEYRKETSESFPDDCFTTPGCSGGYGTVLAVRNEYSVKELFGELLVPVLEEWPFAQRLNLEVGARLSHYSTVDRTHAFKFGGDWAPLTPNWRLRAMYQKAVRAPNIFEFGSPRQQNRAAASADPCAGTVNSTLRALCIATGVPASAINATTGVSSVPNVISGQINAFQGGNPDLEEEDSDTVTVGFAWTGTDRFEGLTAELDWYSIEIDNAISTLSANDVLSACYSTQLNPGADPGSAACGLVLRNPATGGLVGDPAFGVSQANENIALLKTAGIDLKLDYRLDTQTVGALRFSLLGTYVLETTRQPSEELPSRSCEGFFGSTCGSPDPLLRFNQSSVWTLGEFDLGYRWRFLKGTSFDNPSAAVPEFRTIDNRHYLDLQFGWTPARYPGLSLHVGVDNVLNKEPPLVGEDAGPTERNSANTYPGTFDTLGRAFFLSARKQF